MHVLKCAALDFSLVLSESFFPYNLRRRGENHTAVQPGHHRGNTTLVVTSSPEKEHLQIVGQNVCAA